VKGQILVKMSAFEAGRQYFDIDRAKRSIAKV
jgi:hypothetical protein